MSVLVKTITRKLMPLSLYFATVLIIFTIYRTWKQHGTLFILVTLLVSKENYR